MLKREKANSGMSLIEVIVSMLVLSIAVVTVMTTFSMATKVNVKSKELQNSQSLMENLLEYAEAGGSDLATWFTTEGYTKTETSSTVTVESFRTSEGFHKYVVDITTDTNPSEYDEAALNDYEVIQFGGSGSNTLLINATDNTHDDDAHAFYLDQHTVYMDTYFPTDTINKKTAENLKDLIDREIQIKIVSAGTKKLQLIATEVYKIDDSVKLPVDIERTYEFPLLESEAFDDDSVDAATAKWLNQIYLIYSESDLENVRNQDVRFWDEGPYLQEDAKLFIVNQAASSNADIENVITNPNPFTAIDKIYITYKNPNNVDKPPKKLHVYCPVQIQTEGSMPELVCHSGKTLAVETEVRVVTVLVEIYDETKTKLLASRKITRLQ